jgi:hypothetical protein
MSKRRTDVEWEALLSNLSKETKQNGDRMSKSGNIFSGIVSLSIINGISAVGLMLLNMVVNKAWPALEVLTPAIGYFHAFWISLIVWVLWLIKTSISSGLKQQRQQQ